MSIHSQADLDGILRIGQVVGLALREMQEAIAAGVTTRALDDLCARVLARFGARPTPQHVYGFPGASCISVNDEIVHGIPGDRVLLAGDLVKIDVTADLDGYVADAARTVIIGPSSLEKDRLFECARSAFAAAIKMATAGTRISAMGGAIEREVRRYGFAVIRELSGHGVGRKVHEPPEIPNYFEPKCRRKLTNGLVITVEPIVASGSGRAFSCKDGWTVKTADRSLSAHHEETIVITRGEPLLVTAA